MNANRQATNYPSEVAEMALAHAIANDVEKAYRRGDLFNKRRQMMNAWTRYCGTMPTSGRVGKVIRIGA